MSQDKKPGMIQMLKSAKQLQKNMENIQQDIHNAEFTGEAGAGMLKITITGRHEARNGSVYIDPELMKEDKKVLEDLIAAAINDAVRKVERYSKEKLATATQGINLPTHLEDDTQE